MFGSRRGTVLYLLVWAMLGLVLAALVALAADTAWAEALAFALPLALVFSVAAGFSAMYLCRAYPLSGRGSMATALAPAGAAVVMATVWSAMASGWASVLRAAGLDIVLTAPLKAMLFGLGLVLYGLCVLGHYLIVEFERTRAAERRELELQVLAQDAELRMLRTQVDPHFLFNSLNSISALTSLDPQRARVMTQKLSDFFRRSLGLQASRNVPLADEVKLVEDFIAIEQVRFGSRLCAEIEVGAGAGECLVLPMLLQPLVENAVKHGIGGLPEGGKVQVSARREGSILRIEVVNDVDADQAPRPGQGIGLANVRQRLHAAHAHEASVQWTREPTSFRVSVTLPAEVNP
jgi:hypothetical protein